MNKNDLYANYHTHTSRCGHAFGKDEEYVVEAINHGIKEMGFTDHVMLPGIIQKGIRGEYGLLEDYLSSVDGLKEKYKDQIIIHRGFECEYLPDFLDYYRSLLDSGKVEYLILGQHCHLVQGTMRWYDQVPGGGNAVLECAHHMIEGMKTGLFAYLCHPDMFHLWYPHWDEYTIEAAHMIGKAAEEYEFPLEINAGRIRIESVSFMENGVKTWPYPYPAFWDIIAQYKVKVIIGLDCHTPQDYEASDVEYLKKIATDRGLEIIERLDLAAKK